MVASSHPQSPSLLPPPTAVATMNERLQSPSPSSSCSPPEPQEPQCPTASSPTPPATFTATSPQDQAGIKVAPMPMPTSSLSSSSSPPAESFHRRDLPPECIAFSSPAGKRLFVEAVNAEPGYMESYFPLAEQFMTQAEPAYCGLATLAMCLNALAIDPGRVWKGPWRWFSEELFDCCTSLSVAKEKGISMSEFVCLARCHGITAHDRRADASLSLEEFREIVKRSCAASREIVVLNYSRQALGQTGDGHFSPIGGYHAERDMVLLLDVARFKYPPHWVQLSLVHASMQFLDASIGLPRGLIVLKENPRTSRPTEVTPPSIAGSEPSTTPTTAIPGPLLSTCREEMEQQRRVVIL